MLLIYLFVVAFCCLWLLICCLCGAYFKHILGTAIKYVRPKSGLSESNEANDFENADADVVINLEDTDLCSDEGVNMEADIIMDEGFIFA